MKSSARLGIAALAVLLASAALVVALPAYSSAASTATSPAATLTFTLYGDAADGWGTTTTNINNPGPSLTVTEGDTVTIHLYSNDSVTHDWFIDFNNNNVPDAGEPASPTFTSPTTALDFTFTVPTGHVGTATYRCRFHPTTMTGSITIQAAPPPPTFTLYGDALDGWSLTNASGSFSTPGPVLTVNQGQNVTVHLVSADGVRHDFFVDLNNNSALDSGEPGSQDFTGAGAANFSFTLNTPGTYVYRCRYHPTTMWGLVVVKSTAPPPGAPDYTLYAAVIVAIVIVAIAVGILMKRKPRSPPEAPPQQP